MVVSYHHFDPPYHQGGTHNSEGMIALCLPHHKNADIGTYTDEQLKYHKEHLQKRFISIRSKLS